jgi:hypothetical protein
MKLAADESRQSMLELLDKTRRETRALLSSVDPERVIHQDEQGWRVRDILGHLAVWNAEAARSLRAHAQGGEYCCLDSEDLYDDYNEPAAAQRKAWTMEQVWAEYEAAHDELRKSAEALPADKWEAEMLYPWNERGTPARLIRVMMNHERVDHCRLVAAAVA